MHPAKISAIPFTELSLESVSSNMGIMCLPKWRLDSFQLPGEVVFKQVSEGGLKRTHYLTFRKEDKNKKYIRDFIRYFEEDFSRKVY